MGPHKLNNLYSYLLLNKNEKVILYAGFCCFKQSLILMDNYLSIPAATRKHRASSPQTPTIYLAPDEVCHAESVARFAVVSYTRRFTLTLAGGFFSVALSVISL